MSLNKALNKLAGIEKYWEAKLGKKPSWKHEFTLEEIKGYIAFVRKEVPDIFSILGTLKYPGHKENQLVKSCIDDLTEAMERAERLFQHILERPDERHGTFGLNLWTWTAQKNLKRLRDGRLRKGVKKMHVDEEVV
jgi:hypothetical protein